jgi:hypothetical protein
MKPVYLTICGVVMILFGLGYVVSRSSRYVAYANISPGPALGWSSEDPEEKKFWCDTILKLILTPPVLDEVIAQLSLKKNWATKFGQGKEVDADCARKHLQKMLSAKTAWGTNLVEVCAHGDSPDEVCRIVDATTAAYRHVHFQQLEARSQTEITQLKKEWMNQREAITNARAKFEKVERKITSPSQESYFEESNKIEQKLLVAKRELESLEKVRDFLGLRIQSYEMALEMNRKNPRIYEIIKPAQSHLNPFKLFLCGSLICDGLLLSFGGAYLTRRKAMRPNCP